MLEGPSRALTLGQLAHGPAAQCMASMSVRERPCALPCTLARCTLPRLVGLSAGILTEPHIQVYGTEGQGSCFHSLRRASFKLLLLLIKGTLSRWSYSRRKVENSAV